MGVVSECYCKEVYYRHPHNNYYFPPLPLVLALFFAASSLFHVFSMFFSFLYVYVYIMSIIIFVDSYIIIYFAIMIIHHSF